MSNSTTLIKESNNDSEMLSAYQILTEALQRPIAFHRCFAQIGGSACAGIFLSQLWYWRDKGHDSEGWIYKSEEEWKEETCLSSTEIRSARKILRTKGILEEKKAGLPCRLYYRLNKDRLVMTMGGKGKPLSAEELIEVHKSKINGLSKVGAMQAKALGLEWEFVDYKQVILDREGKCGICHQPITKGHGNHRDSLTFDYILPIEKGGRHTPENLRPVHHGCTKTTETLATPSLSCVRELGLLGKGNLSAYPKPTSSSTQNEQAFLGKENNLYIHRLQTEITPETTHTPEREKDLEKEKKAEKMQNPVKEEISFSSQEENKSSELETDKLKTEVIGKEKCSAPQIIQRENNPPIIEISGQENPDPFYATAEKAQLYRFQKDLTDFARKVGKASPGGFAKTVINGIKEGEYCTFYEEWKNGDEIGITDKQDWEEVVGYPVPAFREYLIAHLQGKEVNRVAASDKAKWILGNPAEARHHWEDFKRSIERLADSVEGQRNMGIQNPTIPTYLKPRKEVSQEELVESAMRIQGIAQPQLQAKQEPAIAPAQTETEDRPTLDYLNTILSKQFGQKIAIQAAKQHGYFVRYSKGVPVEIVDSEPTEDDSFEPEAKEVTVPQPEIKLDRFANITIEEINALIQHPDKRLGSPSVYIPAICEDKGWFCRVDGLGIPIEVLERNPSEVEQTSLTDPSSVPTAKTEATTRVSSERPCQDGINELLANSEVDDLLKESVASDAERDFGFIVCRDSNGIPTKVFDPKYVAEVEF